MQDFAISSGLSDLSKEPRRYLWTDAFAVFNYLELYRQTGELGLGIGLHAVNKMQNSLKKHSAHFSNADQLAIILARLSQFYPLCESIENFWSETEHQLVKSWLEHKDINDVMLVTSLAPESYLSCG